MNRAVIEISRSALKNNVEQVRSVVGERCRIMAVVKANAYGHGAVPVSRYLETIGIDLFGVSTVGEGVELREAGVRGTILVLGYCHTERFDDAQANDLVLTATCRDHALQLEAHGRRTGRALRTQIALDTGMHRIGFDFCDIDGIKRFYDSNYLAVEGIFSHLAVSDSPDAEQERFTRLQASRLIGTADALRAAGASVGSVHLLNGHGAVNFPEYAMDCVRVGITIYGAKVEQSSYLRVPLELVPVLTLKTRVTSVRTIEPGETVSYGRTFTASRRTTIASLAIGYADGIPRSLSGGRMNVIVRGELAPSVGRICMDQMMVDVTGIDGVSVGDEAVIIGRSGGRSITVEEIAAAADTVSSDILSGFALRIEGRTFVD